MSKIIFAMAAGIGIGLLLAVAYVAYVLVSNPIIH